jgi:hypothetical protein
MQPTNTELTLITGTADVIVKYGFLGLALVLMIIIAPIIWNKSRHIAYVTLPLVLRFLSLRCSEHRRAVFPLAYYD